MSGWQGYDFDRGNLRVKSGEPEKVDGFPLFALRYVAPVAVMKILSVRQAIVLVLVVVSVVFAVTYVSRNLPITSPPSGPTQISLKFFPSKELEKRLKENRALEVERGSEGQFDFCYRNDSDTPVHLWLVDKPWPCSSVKLALVPEACNNLPEQQQLAYTNTQGLEWKLMIESTSLSSRDGPTSSVAFPVPPRRSGLVRLGWNVNIVGPQTIRAGLASQPGETFQLAVPVVVVEPVRVTVLRDGQDRKKASLSDPGTLPARVAEVGELTEGAVRDVEFLFWSSTRDHFDLKLEKTSSPCLAANDPVRLDAQECKHLGETSGQKVRCAYRLSVTVYERLSEGLLLDLGPLRGHIDMLVTNPNIGRVRAFVEGHVQGQVQVNTPSGGPIQFGTFPRAQGTRKQKIMLRSVMPGLRMAVDEARTADYLRYHLHEAKQSSNGQTWQLDVWVAPNKIRGPFPDYNKPEDREHVIVLNLYLQDASRQSPNTPWRKLRIQVAGIATEN